MNYSENPGSVRVDFYKPENGGWYMTEALDMSEFWDEKLGPHEAVRKALAKTRHTDLSRWIISVVEPYHRNGYPVMLTPGKASYEPWPEYKRIEFGK